jgi:hypothetical protein
MKRVPPISLTAIALILAAACGEAPTDPVDDSTTLRFAKKGKSPPGKRPTLPLTVVIESDYDPDQAPLNDAANRLLADGRGDYIDGVEGVQAFVRDENADESIISGSTWLDLRDSDARTFWVDLRPAADGTSVVVDPEAPPPPLIPWSIDNACGTDEQGWDSTLPCESTQYLSTRVPDTPGPKTARLAAFWVDGGYQYRLFFGKTCQNDEIVPENYLDVVEVQDEAGAGWDFVATTQYGYLLRRPTKGRPRKECLGRVQAPFRVQFRLK